MRANHHELIFHRRPSVPAFMLRGLYPLQSQRSPGRFPPIRVTWTGHRIDGRRLDEFLRLTGLPSGRGVPMLYPHVFGFLLQMVVLTRPTFPHAIWSVLQVRNHILQHAPISEDAVLDLETRVAGQRVLEKGVEVDLHTTIRSGDDLVWESLNTFYYRGRFGPAEAESPLAASPAVGDTTIARWRTPPKGGWRFGGFTGDYNGIHYWSPYARLFGFRGAFHHPQFILGQCLGHLPEVPAGGDLRLDVWLKGPVYYSSGVSLRADVGREGSTFALVSNGEDRPAILARLRPCAPGSRLMDGQDRPV